MIFHLLIVDDEAPIRKGISQFVNWTDYDCTITATAGDGKEAIEILHKDEIHIVITDIRMPDLDGLELASYIQHHFPEIKVIILTGFADFHYAQTAIKYGVSDFIVKPISKDNLITSVKKAQEGILVSTQKESELNFLKEQLLQELTISSDNETHLNKLAQYGISLHDYCVAAFQMNSDGNDLSSLKEVIMRQDITGYCYRYNQLILLVCLPDGPEDFINRLLPCFQDISDIISSLYNLGVFIGISTVYHHGKEYTRAASEAIQALALNFYSQSNISLFASIDNPSHISISAEETLKLYELETNMLNRDFDGASKIIYSIFRNLETVLVNPSDVKNLCIQIYYIGFRILLKKDIKITDDTIIQQITSAKHIGILEEIMTGLIDYVKQSILSSQNTFSSIVHQAIQYIDQHLKTPLHLKKIADELHINASYLSRIFKKETGQSVSEYINLSRVEIAKTLLSDSHNLTYEIAELVGYNDPTYFSSTFKKYTGLSPKDYKNQFTKK